MDWFPLQNALHFNKLYCKVSLSENCDQQSYKAFIALTNGAKIIGKGPPVISEIMDQSDHVGVKSLIFNLFSLVAPHP